MDGKKTFSIERAILDYLIDHPHAQDTLSGIVDWWVMESYIKWSTEEARKVIDDLVGRGLLIEEEGVAGEPRFRLDQKRLEEIRKQLKTEPS